MNFLDSLPNRIIIITAASFAVIILFSAIFSTHHIVTENIKIVQRQQIEFLKLISENAENEFSYASDYITGMAGLFNGHELTNPATADYLLRSLIKDRISLRIKNTFSYGFFILDKNGRLLANLNRNPELIGRSFADEEYFIKTIETGRGILSRPHKAYDDTISQVIIFTAPIRGGDKKITGVLCGGMVLAKKHLIGDMMNYSFNGNGYLYMLNGNRELVMHPDSRRIMEIVTKGKNKLLDRAVDENFEGAGITVNSQGIEMITSFKKIKGTDFILAANYYKTNIYSQIFEDYRVLVIYGSLGGIIFFALTLIIIKRLFSPLNSFIKNLSEIGGTGVMKKIDMHGSADICRLYLAFNGMADKLASASEAMEAANKAKAVFLAKMSHEIRTPMNAIIGMTDLAFLTEDESEKLDYLLNVKESSRHLLEVVNDILDYSKIEAGAMTLEKINFSPYRVMKGVVSTMNFKADEKKIYLKIDVPANFHSLIVAGDPHRFRQVLFNLIGNAVKFTQTGGVTVSAVSESIPGNEDGSERIKLTVNIADTGVGIPPDKIEKIFDGFTQGDAGITREYGGTGLGLTISKEIIELMQGDISVVSSGTGGSVFSFVIQFAPPLPDQEIHNENKHIKDKQTGDKKLKILLAEDNPVNVKLANVVLEKLGHTVSVASNGAEAIDLVRQNEFDAVLMDIEMLVMDGIEASAKIRRGEAGPDKAMIPIIAMTAYSLSELSERLPDAAFSGYISKPIKIEELNGKLLSALDENIS